MNAYHFRCLLNTASNLGENCTAQQEISTILHRQFSQSNQKGTLDFADPLPVKLTERLPKKLR